MGDDVTPPEELASQPQADTPQDPSPEKEEQAPQCKRCSRPALRHSRFCEDHQAHAIPQEIRRRGLRRLDVILVILLVAIVWGYPKVNGYLLRAVGGGAPSDPTRNTGVLADVSDFFAWLKGEHAKNNSEPAPIAAPASEALVEGGETQHNAPAVAQVVVRAAVGASTHCGNNQIDRGEQCDGPELNGATCASLGFSGDCDQQDACVHAGLKCLGNCTFDYSGCTAESQAASQRFVDQGDGTASDRLTGLTWELKCTTPQCTDRHDVLAAISWHDAAVDWLTSLNAEQFAGHNDWRLPTLEELRTLLAAVPPCRAEPCAVAAWRREQTAAAGYWSSTSFSVDNHRAWVVSFYDGDVYTAEKGDKLHIRAVRTGF